ncbi:MAG: hypothetical protein DYG92_11105 [Leptolyngbya sp. PLA1]|nr:hypothetical protein [Leptolyngbya sp. PLA1]
MEAAPALLELAAETVFDDRSRAVRLFRATHVIPWLEARYRRQALAAIAQLVRVYSRLSDDHRRLARTLGAGSWRAVLGPVATDPAPEARRSVALLAEESGDPELFEVLPALLVDRRADVATQAERALVKLAVSLAGLSDTPFDHAPEAADIMRGVLAQALATFPEHRRRGVLVAVLALAHGPMRFREDAATGSQRLASVLASLDPGIASALKTVLNVTRLPLAGRRAMEWMRYPGYRSASERRLRSHGTALEKSLLFGAAHLLVHPHRRDRWRSVAGGAGRGADLWPSPGAMARWPEGPRWGLAFALAGTPSQVPAELGAWLITDRSVRVRMAATRSRDVALQSDLSLDPDARVAHAAAVQLMARRGAGADAEVSRHAGLLARSPHAAVRATVQALAGRRGVVSFAGAASDPTAFAAALRTELRGSASRQLAALSLVRKLGLAGSLTPEIAELCGVDGGGDARVRATAASALCEGDPGHELAPRLLASSDPRVRANVVDALGHRGRGPAPAALRDRIMELKADPHHRVRASVLRLIVAGATTGADTSPVDDDIATLLSSPESMNRLAGVWLLSRVLPVRGGWERWGPKIVQLAEQDRDARVRGRAERVRTRAEVQVRSLWTSSRSSGGGPE